MNLINLLIIFIASLFASTYGTLIGGTSLITIPTLILLGLPPHAAIGTDRFGITGIAIVGWYQFHKKGMINYKVGFISGISILFGSFLGSNLVLQIDKTVLKLVIVIITIFILLFILFRPKMGVEKTKRMMTNYEYLIGAFLSFIVGIYGGFYGVMAGTFLSYILIMWFGQTFLESAATSKIGAFFMTTTAASVFAMNGVVNYHMGITMFIGCCIGSYIGVRYSNRLGNVWIKRIFIVLVLIMVIKLLTEVLHFPRI